MRRILTVALIFACGFTIITAESAVAGKSGALQVGLGTATASGSAYYLTGFQVITLQATGYFFPNEWAVVLAGFSYGFSTEYEVKSVDEMYEFESGASYFDGMAGVRKSFLDGGFIYLGAGLSVGWGTYESALFGAGRQEADLKATLGLVFGAGLTLPITDSLMGVLNARQRFIKSQMDLGDEDQTTFDYGIGGFEMAVGIGWNFGG